MQLTMYLTKELTRIAVSNACLTPSCGESINRILSLSLKLMGKIVRCTGGTDLKIRVSLPVLFWQRSVERVKRHPFSRRAWRTQAMS